MKRITGNFEQNEKNVKFDTAGRPAYVYSWFPGCYSWGHVRHSPQGITISILLRGACSPFPRGVVFSILHKGSCSPNCIVNDPVAVLFLSVVPQINLDFKGSIYPQKKAFWK